jgi:hypothetical protein
VNRSGRLAAPLVAGLALLGPTGALAASPAPDASPSGAALAPDPVPTTARVVRTTPHTPPATHSLPPSRPHRIVEGVARTTPRIVTVTSPPASKREPRAKPKPHASHVERASPKRHVPADPIANVVPLRVDVHADLGAIATQVRDNRGLALAAVALLVAVAVAASGAGLALVARRVA